MSEDTSAKRADRRRRTTRAGRRKPPRMPAGVAGDSWPPSSWPEGGAEGQLDAGVDGMGVELEGGDELLESEEELELEPVSEDDDDARKTAELHVTPLLTESPLPGSNPASNEDEKTNPRVRLDELVRGETGFAADPDGHPTQPKIKVASVAAAVAADVQRNSSVIIARAHVISDAPPPPRPRVDPLPTAVATPALPVETRAPLASELLVRDETPSEPSIEPLAPSDAPSRPREAELSARWIEPAAARDARAEATPGLLEVSPEPSVGAATQPIERARPAPDPAATASTTSVAPEAELDDAGLQLVDVEDVDADGEPRVSRVPPPPPPARNDTQPSAQLPAPSRVEPAPRQKPPPPIAARMDPAPPKRPPPPPAPAKAADEDRQKRKQVRQWWERFFSDDYLMTVLPPTPAQISRQIDFVEASLGLSKGATVLDVGCGLGQHAIELTRRGYLVVGLDLSLAMITRAAEASQEQGLKINFVHADIREMEFDGAFDGVVCMGTTFGFFDDEANRDVLARLNHALRPGGRMLLDIVNRDYVIGLQPNLVWFEGDECVCMEESDFNYFNSRLSVKRTMMREDGRQSNAEYSLRLYSLHELGQLVQQLGFRVIEVSGQEAIRGAFFGAHSPRVLMLAERRAQTPARTSNTAQVEAGRPSLNFPAERNSADVPKPPKPE